jgi:amidase
MAKRISRESVFYSFSGSAHPIARVEQGEEFILETYDCFRGQLRTAADRIDTLDWGHVNPGTGPVFIEGAKAGDILRIDILEITLEKTSVMVAVPGEGVLGDIITTMETVLLPCTEEGLDFKGIRIPLRPMIGVIGVAPAQGEVSNGTPGPHGGNMDCTLIKEGSSLYLTVGVDGALFGAGDLHAAMGDGEIVVCGAETAGAIRFRARTVPLCGLPTPFVETDDTVAAVFSASTVDEAATAATHRMARFLTDMAGLPLNDAGMLMSLVGELKFCQIVDPLRTVRFEFPKSVLAAKGYSLR